MKNLSGVASFIVELRGRDTSALAETIPPIYRLNFAVERVLDGWALSVYGSEAPTPSLYIYIEFSIHLRNFR